MITSSAATGQALTLLLTPILTRLYSPEAFGAFAVLQSVVMIVATGASLRLESAIPIGSSSEVAALLRITAVSAGLVALALTPVALFLDVPAFQDQRGIFVAIPSVLVFLTVVYTVLSNVALRERGYTAVATRNLIQQLGTTGSQLLCARWAPSSLGLAAGLVIGRSLGILSLYKQAARSTLHGVAPSPLFATLRRYWRYPVVFMPSALLNVVGSQLPLLLVASRYGSDPAGNLSQAMRFGAVPAVLIGAAVSSVVMAEIANHVRQGDRDNRRRYLRVTRALLPVSLLWGGLLTFAAPVVLPRLLGPGWDSSGAFSAALALSVASGLLASPLSVVFFIYERSLLNIAIDLSRILLVGGTGLVAWRGGYSPVAAVFAMSVGLTLIYAITWGAGLRVVSERAWKHASEM